MKTDKLSEFTSRNDIEVVFNHQDFFMINKPAGLACHGPDERNLADLLQQQSIQPLLCHRLDKDTSGLLLIAKSSEAADNFRVLFEEHKIEKYYLALSQKKGKKKQGTIKGSIEKSRNGNWKLVPSESKVSLIKTQFFSFSLSSIESNKANEGDSKIENNSLAGRAFVIKLHGGKTHQARVCLKANGSPITGDNRYGGVKAERLYLHAFGLRFLYKDEVIEISCPAEFLKPDDIPMLANSETTRAEPLAVWELPWPK